MARGRIVFLGTSAGVPTKRRGLPSLCLVWNGEAILFDVGEGTQRQMTIAGISLLRVRKIFVSHPHGDHLLGIPGMLMSMTLQDRKDALDVYGPVGMHEFLENLLPTIKKGLTFDVKVHELSEGGQVCRGRDYSIFACKAEHIEGSWAFKFIEDSRPGKFDEAKATMLGLGPSQKRRDLIEGRVVLVEGGRVIRPEEVVGPRRLGFSMVYTGDSAPSESIANFSVGVDILIHESTFDEVKQVDASAVRHSTSVEAAKIASRARPKLLILTHISARYRDAEIIRKQAQAIFPNVIVAEDLQSIDIS